jgi:hypothetical protein
MLEAVSSWGGRGGVLLRGCVRDFSQVERLISVAGRRRLAAAMGVLCPWCHGEMDWILVFARFSPHFEVPFVNVPAPKLVLGSCPFLYHPRAQISLVHLVHQLGGFIGYVLAC